MNKYDVNDVVFFISNGYHIREATVIRSGGGFCTMTMKLQQEQEFENPSYSKLSKKLKL